MCELEVNRPILIYVIHILSQQSKGSCSLFYVSSKVAKGVQKNFSHQGCSFISSRIVDRSWDQGIWSTSERNRDCLTSSSHHLILQDRSWEKSVVLEKPADTSSFLSAWHSWALGSTEQEPRSLEIPCISGINSFCWRAWSSRSCI